MALIAAAATAAAIALSGPPPGGSVGSPGPSGPAEPFAGATEAPAGAAALGAQPSGEFGAVAPPSAEAQAPAGEEKPRPKSFTVAAVRPGRSVVVHSEPGGRPLGSLGDATEWGSRQSFWAVKRRAGWLGVLSPHLPNGELGWIPADPAVLEIRSTRDWIVADLSERRLELRRSHRRVLSFAITIGSPESPTPPGLYSITDGLDGAHFDGVYGCCVLALSGRQPDLPSGWAGGDRLAIHGSSGEIGAAASAGCLRASDENLAALFQRIYLGTPVIVRS